MFPQNDQQSTPPPHPLENPMSRSPQDVPDTYKPITARELQKAATVGSKEDAGEEVIRFGLPARSKAELQEMTGVRPDPGQSEKGQILPPAPEPELENVRSVLRDEVEKAVSEVGIRTVEEVRKQVRQVVQEVLLEAQDHDTTYTTSEQHTNDNYLEPENEEGPDEGPQHVFHHTTDVDGNIFVFCDSLDEEFVSSKDARGLAEKYCGIVTEGARFGLNREYPVQEMSDSAEAEMNPPQVSGPQVFRRAWKFVRVPGA